MLKLLILCLLVVCPMIANSRKANDLEVAKVKSQVNSCVRKTKMEGLFCVVDSMLKWDLTRFSKSHNDKASCCAFWDTTNCLVEKAIVSNSSVENKPQSLSNCTWIIAI